LLAAIKEEDEQDEDIADLIDCEDVGMM